MALRLFENSLFAILLRSTWWYSVLIGLTFIALSLTVLEGRYLFFGVLSASPFFGIAAFSYFKQSHRPSRARILEVDQQARTMSATQIADKITSCYVTKRYRSEAFSGGVAERILERGSDKVLLCTKRFKAGNSGIEPLKKLVAAGETIGAKRYLYVTLGDISTAAIVYAGENNIELIRADKLAEFFDGKAQID